MNDVDPIVTAALSHQWPLFAGLLITVLLRQIRARPELAERIPARWQWALAVGFVVAAALAEGLMAGRGVGASALAAVVAAIPAVLALAPGAVAPAQPKG